MNQIIKELSFQDQPIHIFLFNGEVSFLAQQVADILGLVKPSKTLRTSKTLEKGEDYDIIPTNLLDVGNKKFPTSLKKAPQVAILYQSGFFLFVLRSNKPMAVPFTRWVIREAIPIALEQTQTPSIEFKPSDIVKMMELSAKHDCKFSKQKLEDLGFVESGSKPKSKQLTMEEVMDDQK
ncbi:MAG: Bro-N domain-containing protein [Deltaproteobacteria bacterium]|jgi:prophage antirepressor-like protein|nr:Bro-N domain-containing protein [Deltaproteobacteria bacterium]